MLISIKQNSIKFVIDDDKRTREKILIKTTKIDNNIYTIK